MTVHTKPSPEVWEAVLAHRDRALRVARSRCGSPDEAEDCAQEALARVAAMPDLDPMRIGSLVSTVVANLAVDCHRRRTRAAVAEIRLRHAALPVPGHDDDICDRHEGRWLQDRLAVLSSQDREALELRAAGLSVGEIATALGVTYKVAEHALGRARSGMRAVWRATAAVIGVLCGTRGRPRPAAPAGAAAAAFAGVVLSVALDGTGVGPASTDAHTVRGVTRATAAASFRPVEPRAADRPGAAVPTGSPRGRAGAISAPPRHVAAVPAVRAGDVRSTGASVEERPDGDTVQDVVERCLRHVTVGPYRIECDG